MVSFAGERRSTVEQSQVRAAWVESETLSFIKCCFGRCCYKKSDRSLHNHKLKKDSVLISRKNNWIKLIFNQVFRVPLPIFVGFLPTHLQDPSESVGKICKSFSCSHQPRLKCQTEHKQPWQSGRIMRPSKYIRLPNAFIKYAQPDWESRPPA